MGDRMKIQLLSKSIFSILIFITPLIWSAEFVKDSAELNSTMSNGKQINVLAIKIALPIDFPYKKAFMWGGDEIKMPSSVLSEVNVRIKDEKIYIPFSAISDLGNPKHIFLENNKDEFSIIINGGDASTSYKAILFFKNNCIYRRKVILSEFPNQVWEESNYSFNQSDY
jgi:hypothetical protein